MYIVLVTSKKLPMFNDLLPELRKKFPSDQFSIHGSEDKGYQMRIEGVGDEKAPRAYAEGFIKKWKPAPIFIEM